MEHLDRDSETPIADSSHPDAGRCVFDLEAALARLGGEPALFREMVGFFFGDGMKLFREIQAATAPGDMPAVEKKAHRLKGTMLYLGAETAVQTVARVEVLARAGDVAGVAAEVRTMETEVTRLSEALRPYRPEMRH